MEFEDIVQLIINWLIFLTAPIWAIPSLYYEALKYNKTKNIFLTGKEPIFFDVTDDYN